jgi:ElaB/YqjD/DUF883 family membrane-anchored ribosome-binding protein
VTDQALLDQETTPVSQGEFRRFHDKIMSKLGEDQHRLHKGQEQMMREANAIAKETRDFVDSELAAIKWWIFAAGAASGFVIAVGMWIYKATNGIVT